MSFFLFNFCISLIHFKHFYFFQNSFHSHNWHDIYSFLLFLNFPYFLLLSSRFHNSPSLFNRMNSINKHRRKYITLAPVRLGYNNKIPNSLFPLSLAYLRFPLNVVAMTKKQQQQPRTLYFSNLFIYRSIPIVVCFPPHCARVYVRSQCKHEQMNTIRCVVFTCPLEWRWPTHSKFPWIHLISFFGKSCGICSFSSNSRSRNSHTL